MSSTLMLNADASPVSILPLSIITWEESIRYLVTEKATAIEWYNDWVVHSARWSTRVPAVMILKEYQKKKTGVRFTKGNVFLRDEYRCQYCGAEVNRKTATLDHVLPISHDGKTSWENCTTACGLCNSRKGNNYKIVPKIAPYRPSYFSLIEKRKKMPWDIKHPSWTDYLQ
jgi:5-methylcytosine-specific restriction endonuclease McrA